MNIGVIVIPTATILALNLIPADTLAPGALFWPAWIITAGLLSGAAGDVLHEGFSKLLRIQHVVMFGLIMIGYSELLQTSYRSSLDYETVRETFIAIGLFGTTLAIGSSIHPPPLPHSVTNLAGRHYSPQMVTRIMIACWLLAMFNYVYVSNFSISTIVEGLLAPRFSAPWNRGQLGDWTAFLDFLSNFGCVVPPFAVALALRHKSWTHLSVIAGLICSMIFLAFIVQGGGRRQVAAIIGASALTWFCAKMHSLRPKHYLAGALLILATAVFLDLVLEQRGIGFGAFQYDTPDFGEFEIDNNFQSLSETLKAIPANADFVGFQHVWYVLVRPVPRVFWPGKPLNSGFDLAEYLGLREISLAMTAIGESYMSFGWIGIAIGGFIFGFLAKFWSQLGESDYGLMGSVLYSLGAMTLVIGIRSFIELILMAYPICCWYVIDRVLWDWSPSP